MIVKSPLSWFGSKARLAPKIIACFPPHKLFCEVFGGSGAVLLAKKPAAVEVFNDCDRDLTRFMEVVRNPDECERLKSLMERTLYSRETFESAKRPCDDKIEAAKRFFIRHRQSFGGQGKDWCYSVGSSTRKTAAAISRWRSGINNLAAACERLANVQVECDIWENVVARFDSSDTLFYFDPPYVPETRIAGGYRHELSADDHQRLVAILLSVQGMVVLSGYAHKTYEPLERAGWRRLDFRTCSYANGALIRRTESLWLSPSVTSGVQQRKLFLSPREKMGQGAHHAHKVMVAATTKKLCRAIERLRASGIKPTATNLARATKLSREHLVRRYRHLLPAKSVISGAQRAVGRHHISQSEIVPSSQSPLQQTDERIFHI